MFESVNAKQNLVQNITFSKRQKNIFLKLGPFCMNLTFWNTFSINCSNIAEAVLIRIDELKNSYHKTIVKICRQNVN